MEPRHLENAETEQRGGKIAFGACPRHGSGQRHRAVTFVDGELQGCEVAGCQRAKANHPVTIQVIEAFGDTVTFEIGRCRAGIAAFFINAGVVGMYPIFAPTYPTVLRASGTGFVIGKVVRDPRSAPSSRGGIVHERQ